MSRFWKILSALLLLAAAASVTVITVNGRSGEKDNTAESPADCSAEEDYISINSFLTNDLSGSENSGALDSYIEKFMKRWEIKGGSLAVMKDGRLVYAKDTDGPMRRRRSPCPPATSCG